MTTIMILTQFLAQILPPLRDVGTRPEQDTTLRGQLVRLMTHVDTDVKHCAAELLFVLCKENGTVVEILHTLNK